MATTKQRTAARKNIKKAAAAAKKKQTTEAFAEEDTHGVGQTGREGKNQKTPLAFFRKGVGVMVRKSF